MQTIIFVFFFWFLRKQNANNYYFCVFSVEIKCKLLLLYFSCPLTVREKPRQNFVLEIFTEESLTVEQSSRSAPCMHSTTRT